MQNSAEEFAIPLLNGIWNPSSTITRNPKSIACDPESTVWNSESETVLNYFTRGDTVVFYILSTLNLTNFLTDTSEIRTPRVGPYLSLHRTRSLSINDDDGYENWRYFKHLSRLFQLIQFVKCWQILLELNSKRLYESSGKERESRCLEFTSSTKQEIRHFHVVVVQ